MKRSNEMKTAPRQADLFSTGRKLYPLTVMALLTCLVSLGCSGPSTSPGSATPSTSPIPSGTPTPSQAERAVATVVAKHDSIVDAITDGDRLDMNKINSVAEKSWAKELGESLFALKALKQRTVGKTERKIRSINIQGSKATVLQCVDPRKTKTVSDAPGPDPEPFTNPPGIVRISLVLKGKRWYVTDLKDGGKC
jgi:hypothetical protein